MNPRRLSGLFAALATTIALSFPSLATAADIQCGDAITADTTLTADLVGCAQGLTVDGTASVDPITLDLGGHTISGLGSGSGITAMRANVINGTVTGFDTGLELLLGLNKAERLAISNNSTGIYVEGSMTILNNSITDNGIGALVLHGNGGTVSGNRIAFNGSGYVHATGGGGVVFTSNTVFKNAGRGVFIDNGVARVIGNIVSQNGRDGIWVSDSFAPLFFPYWFADNIADDNGGYGIAFFGVATSPSPPFTVDGGGNAAKHNANPDQCHIIVCAPNRGQAGK